MYRRLVTSETLCPPNTHALPWVTSRLEADTDVCNVVVCSANLPWSWCHCYLHELHAVQQSMIIASYTRHSRRASWAPAMLAQPFKVSFKAWLKKLACMMCYSSKVSCFINIGHTWWSCYNKVIMQVSKETSIYRIHAAYDAKLTAGLRTHMHCIVHYTIPTLKHLTDSAWPRMWRNQLWKPKRGQTELLRLPAEICTSNYLGITHVIWRSRRIAQFSSQIFHETLTFAMQADRSMSTRWCLSSVPLHGVGWTNFE